MEKNIIYVDKSEKIFKILDLDAAILLSPRRFGKTIFLSTIKCFYEKNLAWWLTFAPDLWITNHMKKTIKYDDLDK